VAHAGETLKEKLDELQMGPKEFAIRTDKPEKTITAILKGDSSITPDMAILFEKVLQIPARFWLNAQRNYDEYMAREKQKSIVATDIEWVKKFPIKNLAELGLVNASNFDRIAQRDELLQLFGVASPRAWEKYYIDQQLKAAFRISLNHTKDPFAVSAWLRIGELAAKKIESGVYSDKEFKAILPDIKKIMQTQSTDFAEQLQKKCLAVGVKVIYVPCLTKAPNHGATRWIGDTPIIQLSGRYKRNDIFWFTFFHEVGHILLHRKNDIFIESLDYSENDKAKEQEANNFAIKWTFSEEEEKIVMNSLPLTETSIEDFATSFGTHPAMIIGRFQHKKLIPYYLGKDFIVPIEL
jgi:addiction module HigA family antidote